MCVSRKCFGDNNINRQGDRRFCHQGFGRINQIHFNKRLANRITRGQQESIGDPAAHDQLIGFLRQTFQHLQFAGDFCAANNCQHGTLRILQRLIQRIQLGGQQGASHCFGRKLGNAMRAGLRPVRSAKGIHHKNVAQGGIRPRQVITIGIFADVDTYIFQQYHFPVCGLCRLRILQVILHQADRKSQQCLQMRGNRRQRGIQL